MFEREVKFIYDFNSNKVKKLGATATYTELLPLGIHPAILQYISAEIEYRVFEDRQTLLKHSMFDYSGPEIAKHFSSIADEIKKEKRFSTDFLSKVILHATSFNLNYLIRPNWSLKKLIFDTNESNSVSDILQILNYTYFYKHLTKVIRNYLDKKKLITLNKDEFSDLLVNFDKVSIQSYGKDILDSAIKSMASFFNIGSMNQKSVPVHAIGVFLQEKKMVSHLELLQQKMPDDNKNKIEVNDLKSILFSHPIENVEYIEPSSQKTDDMKIVEPEDTIQPQKLEEEVEEFETGQDEITETESGEKNEENIPDEIVNEEETPEQNDVEIKLRANKEKEVADTLEIDEDQPPENISELKEEYEDPADYLGDQGDDGTDIILTVDDLDENEIVEFEDEIESVENDVHDSDNDLERGELIDLEDDRDSADNPVDEVYNDTVDENIAEEKVEELELSDDEEEDQMVIEEEVEYEVPHEPEDDYSYPQPTETILTADDDEIEDQNGETEEQEDEIENKEDSLDDNPVIDEEIDLEEESTPQTTLFGEVNGDDLVEDDNDDSFINEFGTPNYSKRIDIADLLENRNMTKIIEVVFDYDMEEFANSIERICDSTSRQEAFATLQEIFEVNQVNPTSKEAQAFRDIISEYFDQS